MFVVLQNVNTDLPKRLKGLICDKFNTTRAVLLWFQICAADVLIFEPVSWLCCTNRIEHFLVSNINIMVSSRPKVQGQVMFTSH